MLPDGSSSEATPPESSLRTDIIVLEALVEAERDGVAVGQRSNFKKFPTHTQDHGDA